MIPVAAEDARETMGVNSRIQLAEADRILRIRKAEDLMAAGVTITDPYSTYIEQDVEVGQDTVILPGTMLQENKSREKLYSWSRYATYRCDLR